MNDEFGKNAQIVEIQWAAANMLGMINSIMMGFLSGCVMVVAFGLGAGPTSGFQGKIERIHEIDSLHSRANQ